jgi:hypothetical protein
MRIREILNLIEDRHDRSDEIPRFLYHATYFLYLQTIKIDGLHGNNPQKNYED